MNEPSYKLNNKVRFPGKMNEPSYKFNNKVRLLGKMNKPTYYFNKKVKYGAKWISRLTNIIEF
jgi:hypothetical protein